MRDPSRRLRKESGASRVCPGACWGPWPGRMCPSWPHKAPLSSRCSPASWGMLSSHCGPGECHLMVRARLTSWSPCALPSQCPRPQISQLPGTSCKKEHEAAGEDRVPHSPRWAWSHRRGFLQPTPLGLAHPGLPQGVQAAHTAHLATSPPTPSPSSLSPGGSSSQAGPSLLLGLLIPSHPDTGAACIAYCVDTLSNHTAHHWASFPEPHTGLEDNHHLGGDSSILIEFLADHDEAPTQDAQNLARKRPMN